MSNQYPPEFEELWSLYPKRAGGNPKRKAFKAYQARIKQGCTHSDIKTGLINYKAFCEATDRILTEYVMQAATFFGPDERWEDEYIIPKKTTRNQEWARIPFNNDDLEPWARKNGFPSPTNSETYVQYRSRLQKLVEQRINETRA